MQEWHYFEDKVAVSELEEVLPNATQEEIEQIEHGCCKCKKCKGSNINSKHDNKKSGNMSQKDRNQDNMFADPRVRICVGTGSGAFGVRRSKNDGGFNNGGKFLVSIAW